MMDSTEKPHRKAGRNRKRDKILDSAIEVFALKGSNSATIADVAKKARVAMGTLYVYFESKEALLQCCMDEVISIELEAIIKKTATINDPMDRLYAFFMQHITLVHEKPYVARFITVEVRQSESFAHRNPGYNPMQRYLDFVEEIAVSAINSGRIRAIDPKAFSLLLVGAMDLIIWQWLATDVHLDIETITFHIRQILQHGILGKELV
ncbi:MAG: TetR/AcrR family transcriptional regulator [Candidatus Cloacimonetes bacterium]|nr:TetR/AcrR family transcriptional regulator [Candidatus Cloacimonadota bacterium]